MMLIWNPQFSDPQTHTLNLVISCFHFLYVPLQWGWIYFVWNEVRILYFCRRTRFFIQLSHPVDFLNTEDPRWLPFFLVAGLQLVSTLSEDNIIRIQLKVGYSNNDIKLSITGFWVVVSMHLYSEAIFLFLRAISMWWDLHILLLYDSIRWNYGQIKLLCLVFLIGGQFSLSILVLRKDKFFYLSGHNLLLWP